MLPMRDVRGGRYYNKMGQFSKREDDLIKTLIESGSSYYEIADKLDRSYQSIFTRINRLGLIELKRSKAA